jgi:hypothetical protein
MGGGFATSLLYQGLSFVRRIQPSEHRYNLAIEFGQSGQNFTDG